ERGDDRGDPEAAVLRPHPGVRVAAVATGEGAGRAAEAAGREGAGKEEKAKNPGHLHPGGRGTSAARDRPSGKERHSLDRGMPASSRRGIRPVKQFLGQGRAVTSPSSGSPAPRSFFTSHEEPKAGLGACSGP